MSRFLKLGKARILISRITGYQAFQDSKSTWAIRVWMIDEDSFETRCESEAQALAILFNIDDVLGTFGAEIR